MPIRVLIVDDHEIIRVGLRGLVERAPDLEVCGIAADALEAVTMAAERSPDVVLMDMSLGRVSGIDATRQIVESGGGARVVMLTWRCEPEDVRAALAAGAAGYLVKDGDPSSIADAVRAAHRGEPVMAAAAARALQLAD